MMYRTFYSELGKLLYAIADIDGSISKKEKQKLQDIVKKELVPAENNTDEFGTDAAYYAEFEFDIADDAIMEPEVAFESFMNYIDNHKTAIDKRMISATRKVAGELSEAYYHTSKKEKELLEKLNKKLDDILKEKQ